MEKTKRITLFVEPDFHRKVKSSAAIRGQTISELVKKAIEKELDLAKQPVQK